MKSRRRKEVRLPPKEYAKVMHELNTNLTKEQRKKKYITKSIGAYIYQVEVYGFDDYRIINKKRIR